MKTQNEQITARDYQEIRKSITTTICRLQRALQYGDDMRSSTIILARDAVSILSAGLSDVDSGYWDKCEKAVSVIAKAEGR